MGYELHIFRQSNYEDDDEKSNISLEEWLNYVATDPELELTNGYDLPIPGIESTWQDRPGYCEWLGHPKSDAGTIPWFDFWEGYITTKYPDPLTIKKMVQISTALDAKLRGDDGEYYDQSYFTNGGYPIAEHQDNSITPTASDTSAKKPWWKFW